MAEPEHIPMPWSRRVLFWRQRYAPIVVWVAAVGLILLLAQQRTRYVEAPAIAQARDATVAPLEDGVLHGIIPALFEPVEAGDLVALMDDAVFRAEKASADAELARLRAELASTRETLVLDAARRNLDFANDTRRFILNEEEARLGWLDRMVEQEANKVALERLALMVARQRELVDENIMDVSTYDEVRLRHATLAVQLKENEAALAVAETRLREATRRRESYDGRVPEVDYDVLLQPLRDGINVQDAMVQALAARGERLKLKAPITGQVSQVLHRAGETVLAGEPLLTITGVEAARVVAYVSEAAAKTVAVGADVEVRGRYASEVHAAHVVQTGVGMAALPVRLQRNAAFPEWGRPMLIGDVPPGVFLPGEVLNVRIAQAR